MHHNLMRDRLPQNGLPSHRRPARRGRTGAATGKSQMRVGTPRSLPQAKPAAQPPRRGGTSHQPEVMHPKGGQSRQVRRDRGPSHLPAQFWGRQNLGGRPKPGRPPRHPRRTPGKPLVIPRNHGSLDRPNKVGHNGGISPPTLLERQQGCRRGRSPQCPRSQGISPGISSPIKGRQQGGGRHLAVGRDPTREDITTPPRNPKGRPQVRVLPIRGGQHAESNDRGRPTRTSNP